MGSTRNPPDARRTRDDPTDRERELQRYADAETYQSYFPDRAPDEAHPTPGIDAVHHHFTEYLNTHPGEKP